MIDINEVSLLVEGGANCGKNRLAGPVYFTYNHRGTMDTPIALSLGSLIGLITLFYQWHKDSKETAKLIQKLETEVEQLKDYKQDIKELKNEISEIKDDMNSMQQTLTRIDTNVQNLMQ